MDQTHDPVEPQSASVGYTLSMFAEEVHAILAPAGIETRLQETADGTRAITAWLADDPQNQAEFPIDQVRIGPYQAHIIATIIQRSFNAPAND
jgi:hypothetical protein